MIQDNTSQVAHKEIYSIILSCACLSAISRNHRMFTQPGVKNVKNSSVDIYFMVSG